MLTRRQFLKRATILTAGAALCPDDIITPHPTPDTETRMLPIQTVTGPLPPGDLGVTLIHEHVICDFVGADRTGPHRWNRDEVVEVMLPYLEHLRAAGCRTFVDCSPKYIARDPLVLQRLAQAADLHIITNTGLYKDPFLPPYALQGTAESLADDWTREAEQGIDETGIRPGFTKIAANEGPLSPIQQKIVRAAALTHLRTGLTIASHTTQGPTALEELDLLAAEGVAPQAFIWVHADAESDAALRREAAARGAWIELDSIDAASPERHITMLKDLLDAGRTDQLLISQDAGWYSVGEPRGGAPRPYHKLLTDFVPALRAAGIPQPTIDALLIHNPARALQPTIRSA